MIDRDATLDDVDKILECIIDFWEDRNHKDYEKNVVKDFLIKCIKRKHRYAVVCEDKGQILGGQISEVEDHPFTNEWFLAEKIWFTSPKISKFKRAKVAYGVLSEIPYFMNKFNLKRVVNHVHSTDGSEGCTSANKMLQKMGYQLLWQKYVKTV